MPDSPAPPPVFVGRRLVVEKVLRSLGESGRTAVVWGLPGIGKSTLCSEVARRWSSRGAPVSWLDLEVVLSDRQLASLAPEALARRLISAVVERGDRSRADAAFDAALKKAAREFASSHAAVVVRQKATHGAQISDVHIRVEQSAHRLMVALQQYAHDVARAVEARARSHDCSEVLLVVDTAELLYRFDDRVGESNADRLNYGIARWFCSRLLETLCRETGVRVLVAGREPLHAEFESEVYEFELAEWGADESLQYGLASGLAAELAEALYPACQGIPMWTSMVVDLCRAQDRAGERPTGEWLRSVARSRPAEEWLPKVFLQRLDPAIRDVVRTAALPRSLTRELLQELLECQGHRLTPDEWSRLCDYSFIQRKVSGEGVSRRSMHSLARTAILVAFETDEPGRLRELHARAAAYFEKQDLLVERYYHSFASGDASCFEEWDDVVEERFDRFDFDLASELVDAALAEDYRDRFRAVAPGVEGHALLWKARILRRRDQISDALDAYRTAVSCFRSYGAAVHEVEALFELARLERISGDVVRADEAASRALTIARAEDSGHHVARILENLAGLPNQDRGVALRHLEEARIIFHSLEDDHSEADVILAMADFTSDHQRRLELFDEALGVFRESGCDVGRGDVLRRLAVLKASREENEEAFALLDEAEALFKSSEAHEWRASALRTRAHILAMLRRYDEAHLLLRQAGEIYNRARQPSREALVMRDLAVVSTDWLGMDSAFEFLQTAIARSTEIDDIHGIASAMETLGDLQKRRALWPLEQSSYERALDGYSACSEWSAMIRVWRSLASSACVVMDLDVAATYAERAFQVAEGQRPASSVPIALEIGSIHLGRPLIGLYFSPWEHVHPIADTAQLDRARHWFGLAEQRSSHGGAPRWHGLAKKGLGDVAAAEEDWETAIARYRDASEDLRVVRDRLSVAWLTQAMADGYLKLGRDEEARPLFQEAMLLFDETNESWT